MEFRNESGSSSSHKSEQPSADITLLSEQLGSILLLEEPKPAPVHQKETPLDSEVPVQQQKDQDADDLYKIQDAYVMHVERRT